MRLAYFRASHSPTVSSLLVVTKRGLQGRRLLYLESTGLRWPAIRARPRSEPPVGSRAASGSTSLSDLRLLES
jgi:hypothetical protein